MTAVLRACVAFPKLFLELCKLSLCMFSPPQSPCFSKAAGGKPFKGKPGHVISPCRASTQSRQQLLLLLAHARCFIGPCDSWQVTPSSLVLPPLGTLCPCHLHLLSYSLVPVLSPKTVSLSCQDLLMSYLTEPYPVTALTPPLPPSLLPRLFPLKGLSPLTT